MSDDIVAQMVQKQPGNTAYQSLIGYRNLQRVRIPMVLSNNRPSDRPITTANPWWYGGDAEWKKWWNGTGLPADAAMTALSWTEAVAAWSSPANIYDFFNLQIWATYGPPAQGNLTGQTGTYPSRNLWRQNFYDLFTQTIKQTTNTNWTETTANVRAVLNASSGAGSNSWSTETSDTKYTLRS